jgi:hypothetical protein
MGKLYLFSEVHGIVKQKGAAIEGAVIEREYVWGWKNKTYRDQTITNALGEFSFPEATEVSLWASLVPHEPIIKQTILIKHKEKTYKAWLFDKENYKSNSELNGRAISLLCDLDAQTTNKGAIYGICELQ